MDRSSRLLMLLVWMLFGLATQIEDVQAQSRAELVSPQLPDASKRCQPVGKGRHVTRHLPPLASPAGDVSFAGDWARSRTGGWFGIQAMDDCRISPDGFLTWHNKAASRVEVQPSDDPLDLDSNSERAEMLIMQDADGAEIEESPTSGVQFYATSYYFPETWHGQQLPWSAFAPTDCTLRNQSVCNSWSFVWQFYGWGGLSAAQSTIDGPQLYRFNQSYFSVDQVVTLGKWTDFIFMVDWKTGGYKIWRRDQGQALFAMVLSGETPVPSGRKIYVKQGLYRGGKVSGRTDVLWIGPSVRGSSFAAVEREAFGTVDGSIDEPALPSK